MAKQSDYGHWSRYWQTGHITSLPQDFAKVYDGEIEAFWKQVADDLPDGAKVLDVCAGNGPVAMLIARHAPTASIWASDAAAIDPTPALAQHPDLSGLSDRITFLPETATETLGALDERFALLVSQYGVEYTDWSASAKAMAKVLEPGGKLALVTHVPTSAMVAMMKTEQREYALLDSSGALESLRKLGVEGNNSARKALKRALVRVRTEAGNSALLISFVQSTSALLDMAPETLRAQQAAIRQYARDLVAGQKRARDLLDTNERILEHPRWFEAFTDAGLELVSEQELIYQGQHRCGLALVFKK